MNILKTKVAEYGLTKLIQNLGRDTTPDQFVREFTQNAIEAIQRQKELGEIHVTFNEHLANDHPDLPKKLCFIDNGDGMTCEEMIEHLNNLSSSGHDDNVYENFGVGGKIASLTRNHAGVMYESWKDGIGARIVIYYDKENRSYGVMPVELTDGDVTWCMELDDSQKPSIIDQHGTRVTLLGMEFEESDTMSLPINVRGSREAWLAQYLNTRYFEIPDDIKLKVRIGYYRPVADSRHNYMREIQGQHATLDKRKIDSGTVKLTDAKIHWWILDEHRKQGKGRELVKGHTGCINQGELFDIADGRSNRAANFGIIFGKDDVALYVEPNSGSGYVQNTARTRLIQRDGSELPWERWYDEFKEKMPSALAEYVKKKMSLTQDESHAASIRDRLKSVERFYSLSRYKKDITGKYSADPESETMSMVGGARRTDTPVEPSSGSRGDVPGGVRDMLMSTLKEGGTTARKVKPDKFPEFVWISIHTHNRSLEELDDRAAEYLQRDNIIRGNKDFSGFTDMIDYFVKQFNESGMEGYEQIVSDTVYEYFEQQLIETVVGAQSLKNRPRWNPDQFESSVSQESLTAVCMCRYHIMQSINRTLGSKLGARKKKD